MEKYKRDNTPMPDYYNNWEKLAKQIDDEDSEEEVKGGIEAAKNPVWQDERKPQNQAEMMARTRGAKPNTSIVVKGARQKLIAMAEEFKQQGNAYFVSLEYSKAIECYTRSLKEMEEVKDNDLIENKLDLKKLVLSNRA